MAPIMLHFLILSSLFLSTSVRVATCSSPPPTVLSCNQTPYPQLCTSSVGTPYGRLSFRDSAFRATMERVVRAHQLALAVDQSTMDDRAKAAWSDCLALCEDTISKLNSTCTSAGSSSHEDAQTWLSAALANQETCRNGFADLGSSFPVQSSPFMSNNVSESICNDLAINKASSGGAAASLGGGNRRLLSDGFPRWVSAADRKLLQSSTVKANIVVAQDGSGDYKTISEAVAASVKLRSGTSRYVIHVKAGTYKENVQITKSMKNLMMVGDGIGSTVVTGSKNVQDGSTTFQSATFAVTGDGFIAQDMTFENTAGAAKHQAVALRSGSDLSVFYRCSFKGYQDTLYVYSQRQFYRNCDIYGTVDFIFGDAAVVLQSCNIYIRRPMASQKNTVTAQGRSDPNENTGISIHDCTVAAASDLQPVQGSFKSFLGRPWKAYSRTVVMKTSIGSLIDPAGWLEWDGNFALSTLYYGEYGNTGAGAGTGGRVKWAGYHVMTATDAAKFTVGNFISGASWIPATGVPYTSGL
ncbi:pectinesterase-like [Iris pallida]|uniref:Pectinesterase n=1 Tax=Iris pallida TaxID=29817 RepID=A0AAX6FGX5_IRIPA|nr:pectinesterase-like [Iris pallida]